MNFLEHLSSYTSVSKEASDFLKEMTVRKRMPAGQLLHSEGDICNRLWFIEKGAVRWYFLNEDGRDITDSFATENSFVTAFDSFFQRKPSRFFIETLEKCDLTQIEYQHLEESLKKFPRNRTNHPLRFTRDNRTSPRQECVTPFSEGGRSLSIYHRKTS